MGTDRIERAQAALREQDVQALLVGPSPDLRWLTGYHALPLERLTLLVVPADADPQLLVPRLEAARAEASGVGAHVTLRVWDETEDPFEHVRDLVRSARVDARGTLAVQDHLFARFLLALQATFPEADWVPGSRVTAPLRRVKTDDEIDKLRQAAQAIDRVHEQVPSLLAPGRTEAEVARDITERILDEHDQVNFVIVAAGPNGASPHHEPGHRPLEVGDTVVVDVGGTRDGYCSDATRNYALGDPPAGYRDLFATLSRAQAAGVAAAFAGSTADDVDAVCRQVIWDAGHGDHFIHRTGHGIGVEAHEEPWIAEGDGTRLVEGMAFSIEPGIYLPGHYGARIEDIVVARAEGGERLNRLSRELREVAV